MLNNISIWCSFALLLIIYSVPTEGQYTCRSTGHFRAQSPPPGQCTSRCCVENDVYFTFECSPLVTPQTEGILTLKSFQNSQSKCNNTYHSDRSLVVSLSTGWYNGGARCSRRVVIRGNRKIVIAKVVDECDSTKGCNAEEGYHPPCGRDIVAASKAVWYALGIPQTLWGAPIRIKWADAVMNN